MDHMINSMFSKKVIEKAICFIVKDDSQEYGWQQDKTGRRLVSLSHIHPHRKNSSSSQSPNPTGIKLSYHLHPHRIMSIYIYPYTCTLHVLAFLLFQYLLINIYKIIKIMIKET